MFRYIEIQKLLIEFLKLAIFSFLAKCFGPNLADPYLAGTYLAGTYLASL